MNDYHGNQWAAQAVVQMYIHCEIILWYIVVIPKETKEKTEKAKETDQLGGVADNQPERCSLNHLKSNFVRAGTGFVCPYRPII